MSAPPHDASQGGLIAFCGCTVASVDDLVPVEWVLADESGVTICFEADCCSHCAALLSMPEPESGQWH